MGAAQWTVEVVLRNVWHGNQKQASSKMAADPARRSRDEVPATRRALPDYAEQARPPPSGNPLSALRTPRGHIRRPDDDHGAQNHGLALRQTHSLPPAFVNVLTSHLGKVLVLLAIEIYQIDPTRPSFSRAHPNLGAQMLAAVACVPWGPPAPACQAMSDLLLLLLDTIWASLPPSAT